MEKNVNYFCEFRYKVPHYSIQNTGWVRVGEAFPNQVLALRYCYDLAGRDASVIDYRVLDKSGRVVFIKNSFTPSLEGA